MGDLRPANEPPRHTTTTQLNALGALDTLKRITEEEVGVISYVTLRSLLRTVSENLDFRIAELLLRNDALERFARGVLRDHEAYGGDNSVRFREDVVADAKRVLGVS